jgi:hypothetical protein
MKRQFIEAAIHQCANALEQQLTECTSGGTTPTVESIH